MNAPSVKNLTDRLGLTVDQAKVIRTLIHNDCPMRALKTADRFLGTHGVERLEGILYYCNTGESYGTTLCYNQDTEHIFIGDWGTFVETAERNGTYKFN